MDPLPSKLPDGKIIAFTMDDRELIRALLLEDEDHLAWVEKNSELQTIVDFLDDQEYHPTVYQWKQILQAAKSDYENTPIKEIGELAREILCLFGDNDPPPHGIHLVTESKLFSEIPGRLQIKDIQAEWYLMLFGDGDGLGVLFGDGLGGNSWDEEDIGETEE